MTAEVAYKKVFERPEALKEAHTHYCPGCGHSIAHRLVAECIDELGLRGKTIGVPPVGCAVLAYNYFNFDMVEAPHGRALAVATGIKRVQPDRFVLSYQGDGDLAAIGTAETIHAGNRGERITTIVINNAIYGMTGGQMAPTTLVGQVTTTTHQGRQVNEAGGPIRVAEILAQIDGVAYSVRCAVNTPANYRRAKKCIKQAFDMQRSRLGFTFVEFLSACPVGWGMTPLDSLEYIEEKMMPVFPLGEFKNVGNKQ